LSHNLAGYQPILPDDLDKFNYASNPQVMKSDILIIGLQEIIEMKSKNLK